MISKGNANYSKKTNRFGEDGPGSSLEAPVSPHWLQFKGRIFFFFNFPIISSSHALMEAEDLRIFSHNVKGGLVFKE